MPPGIQSIPLGLGRTQRRRGVPPPCDRPTPCFPGEAARPPSVGAAGSHTPTCGGGLLVSPHPRQHNFFVCLLFFFKYESLSRLRSFLVAQTSGPRLSKPNGLLRAPAPPGAGPGWKAGGLGPKHRLSVTFLPGQLGGELGVTGCLLTEETAPRPPGAVLSPHWGDEGDRNHSRQPAVSLQLAQPKTDPWPGAGQTRVTPELRCRHPGTCTWIILEANRRFEL